MRLPEEILDSTSLHAGSASDPRGDTVPATAPDDTDNPAARSFNRLKPAMLSCKGMGWERSDTDDSRKDPWSTGREDPEGRWERGQDNKRITLWSSGVRQLKRMDQSISTYILTYYLEPTTRSVVLVSI